ncbi:hypothetical protein DFR59_11212 [Falsibacillus pallidus]|uniref:Uncharacterized protein n=1 Tax=Falsibacillus pallidus TaxID=493781 RepID=A0A370GA93_9BACI|nr:hypothetical protein DFR59_11212 [Falsibacillus pallidus]
MNLALAEAARNIKTATENWLNRFFGLSPVCGLPAGIVYF